VFERKLNHPFALSSEYAFNRRQYAFNTLPGTSVESSRNVIGGPDIVNQQLQSQGGSRSATDDGDSVFNSDRISWRKTVKMPSVRFL
jgi:hypothetical protein